MIRSLARLWPSVALLFCAALAGCGGPESRATTQSETEKFLEENPDYAKPAELPTINTGTP